MIEFPARAPIPGTGLEKVPTSQAITVGVAGCMGMTKFLATYYSSVG